MGIDFMVVPSDDSGNFYISKDGNFFGEVKSLANARAYVWSMAEKHNLRDVTYSEKLPHWNCEECGHKDSEKPMPKDRKAFYTIEEHNCPNCKSPGYHPIGW